MKLPFHVISRAPPIYISVAGRYLGPVLAAIQAAKEGASATLLLMLWWDGISDLRVLTFQHLRSARLYPGLRLVYLCNTRAELQAFTEVGLEAVFCNHNAFVDETIFSPETGIEPRWRALVVAALAPYKRLHLARAVSSLAILAYEPLGPTAYSHAIRSRLADKVWVNMKDGRLTWLDSRAVSRVIRHARVGLCLSAREGAMYASAEYLLSGLPVVTTPSTGGRDELFSEETSIVAPPEPSAIDSAVEALIERGTAPSAVRDKTLRLMQPHRSRFNALIRDLHPGAPFHGSEARFVGRYRHRMFAWLDVIEIETACRDRRPDDAGWVPQTSEVPQIAATSAPTRNSRAAAPARTRQAGLQCGSTARRFEPPPRHVPPLG